MIPTHFSDLGSHLSHLRIAGDDLEIGEEGRGSVSGERKGIGPPCQVFK